MFKSEPFGPLEENCFKKVSDDLQEIGDIIISLEDVKNELLSIKLDKSMGPDNVHRKVLNSLATDDRFVAAVHKLFVRCAETCRIPSDWKKANVIALHKKGPKNLAQNYRPISLTCILCKVYEKLLRKHILSHVSESISNEQHGFTNGRSQ